MPSPLESEALPSPWSALADDERSLLLDKLVVVDSSADPEFTMRLAGERFDLALIDRDAANATERLLIPDRILTLRNFMSQAGAGLSNSLWSRVACIKGVRHSYLELTVHSRDELLGHLGRAGFVINREPFWSTHKFDSARAVTRFSREPSLHFVNDRAGEPGYGPDYFFVHWDVTSVWFEESSLWCRKLPGARLFERLRAGLRHKTGFAQSGLVQAYLANRGEQPPSDFA